MWCKLDGIPTGWTPILETISNTDPDCSYLEGSVKEQPSSPLGMATQCRNLTNTGNKCLYSLLLSAWWNSSIPGTAIQFYSEPD